MSHTDYKYISKFALQDRVNIDGDGSIHARVTAVTFRHAREPQYGVSYVYNGDAKEVWIEEWRLTFA